MRPAVLVSMVITLTAVWQVARADRELRYSGRRQPFGGCDPFRLAHGNTR